MNAIANLARGLITPVALMRIPKQGSQAAPFTLDFTSVTALDGDLAQCFQTGVFDFVQSIFIDNRANTGTFKITFPGLGPRGSVIQAQPYSQGWYPVPGPVGDGRFVAEASSGQRIDVIFANVPMPYFVWGPVDGVLVTPSLTNRNNIVAIVGATDHQLVAGVALKTIKLYRGLFSVDSPAILKFTDGPGGALVGPPASLTAGGSMFLQASGVPWATTTAGTDLTLNVSASCNLYYGAGYVQD